MSSLSSESALAKRIRTSLGSPGNLRQSGNVLLCCTCQSGHIQKHCIMRFKNSAESSKFTLRCSCHPGVLTRVIELLPLKHSLRCCRKMVMVMNKETNLLMCSCFLRMTSTWSLTWILWWICFQRMKIWMAIDVFCSVDMTLASEIVDVMMQWVAYQWIRALNY